MAIGSVTLGLLLLWAMPSSHNPNETQTRASSSPTTTKPSITSSLTKAVSRPQVFFSIPVFLVGTLRYTTLNVLIQHSSVRFNTSISQGSLYYTETAIINIFLFLFLIPRVTAWVRERYHVRQESIDLALVRISVGMLLLGSLSIGLAREKKWLPLGSLTVLLPISITYADNFKVFRFLLQAACFPLPLYFNILTKHSRKSYLHPVPDILLYPPQLQSHHLRIYCRVGKPRPFSQ
jgi:hypothetical protein